MKIKLKLNNSKLRKRREKDKVEEQKPEWLKSIEKITKNLNQDKKVFKGEDRDIVVDRTGGLNGKKSYSRKSIFDEE